MPRSTEGSAQARAIVFTYNNYEEGDLEKIKAMSIFNYGCVGKEVGESGTPHLQGYLQLHKRSRIKGVTDLLAETLGRRPHTEIAKGNSAQNQAYCKKDGEVTEWGDARADGRRVDLEAAYDDARSDMKMIDVADKHKGTYIRYYKGIERVRQLHNEAEAEAFRMVEVVVHSGPTGCGKTRAAMTEEGIYKIQGDQLQWWDGYEGQRTILIDEYSNNIPITVLLGLLDGYKLRLPVKGGFSYARWTKVHMTTNLKKDEMHALAKEEHREAMWRRITHWKSYWSLSDNPWLKASEDARALNAEQAVMADPMVLGRRRRAARSETEIIEELGGYAQDMDQSMFDSMKRARYSEDFSF